MKSTRLLYVALTRAKIQAHVVGCCELKTKAMATKYPHANSFWGMLWPGISNEVEVKKSQNSDQIKENYGDDRDQSNKDYGEPFNTDYADHLRSYIRRQFTTKLTIVSFAIRLAVTTIVE